MGRHAVAFHRVAASAGYQLAEEQKLPWLTRYGHLHPPVRELLPANVVDALDLVLEDLDGDPAKLRAKTRGAMRADFLLLPSRHVEYDERSHFTRVRMATFARYPDDVPLAFDADAFCELCEHHYVRAERGFAHKTADEFPGPGGRMRQRAYFDAFRDLAAPHLQGAPLVLVACPKEDPAVGLQRFVACLKLDREIRP